MLVLLPTPPYLLCQAPVTASLLYTGLYTLLALFFLQHAIKTSPIVWKPKAYYRENKISIYFILASQFIFLHRIFQRSTFILPLHLNFAFLKFCFTFRFPLETAYSGQCLCVACSMCVCTITVLIWNSNCEVLCTCISFYRVLTPIHRQYNEVRITDVAEDTSSS
jgi:hypothetical protein